MQKTQTQPTIWWELERAREKASLTLSLTLSLARELFRIKEKDESRKYKEFKEELIVAQNIQLIFPFPARQQRQRQQKQKLTAFIKLDLSLLSINRLLSLSYFKPFE